MAESLRFHNVKVRPTMKRWASFCQNPNSASTFGRAPAVATPTLGVWRGLDSWS